jgi:uncharacterized protein YjbI with pentapeptide repeats
MGIAFPDHRITPLGQVEGREWVRIAFYDRAGREAEVRDYPIVDREEVFEAIEAGRPIDLSGFYIKDLSLADYRERKGMEDETEIELPPLTASEAFFDHHRATDLSAARFGGERLDLSGARFADGDLRLYKARFPEGGLAMKGVRFGKGNLNLKFATFQKEGVDLEGASFDEGGLSFVNAEFGAGSVNFQNTDLGDGDLDFHFARFSNGHISFDGMRLGEGKLDMRKADLGDGRFDMRRAEIGNGDVLFDESEFKKGKVNFRSTTFGKGELSFRMADLGEGDLIFDKASFGEGNIIFRKAVMERVSFRDCHIDHYLDLRVAKAESIDLSDTVVRGIIDMIPRAEMEIATLYLIRVRNLGQLFIDWDANNVERLIEEQIETSAQEKADQYRMLKGDFNSIGQYDHEDRAYVRFKRHERAALLQSYLQRTKWNALWAYPSTAFQWLVFDKMGKYATSPLRVFLSILLVYSSFSVAYAFLPFVVEGGIVPSGNAEGLTDHLLKGIYHSGIPFLDAGADDYHAVGQIRWISALEGFIGVFLMSYFTVAFVRKILR